MGADEHSLSNHQQLAYEITINLQPQ